MKKIVFACIALIFITSCSISKQAPESSEVSSNTPEEKISQVEVTTSIIPLASVVNTIGGDYVNVTNIIPSGVSPHGFDMSAKSMAQLQNTELVFMVGLEHIDGFLEKAATAKKQIHLADGMELLAGTPHEHHDEHGEDEHHDEHEDHHEDEHEEHHNDEHKEAEHDNHEHEDEHHDEDNHDEHEEHEAHEEENHDEHEHNHDKDPHVWLGKDQIITIAGKVRDELSSIMPEHAEYFSANVQKFESDLNALYDEFSSKHAGKTANEFIVFHDAYNYLLASLHISKDLKVPFSENVLHETTVAHMKELTDEIENHGISVLYKEPQFSSKGLEELAGKYNIQVLSLDPLGKNPEAGGYIEHIKNNLDNLGAIYE